MSTAVELIPAQKGQLGTLRHLAQLYLYDFSVFFCNDPVGQIDEEGLYDLGYPLERYVEQPGYWAYVGRVGGKLAGFVLVSDRVRHRTGPGRLVDEFFVLRCYRRRGVGRALACQTFDTYRGYWEVAEVSTNTPAQAFWRQVIDGYTQGRYREVVGDFGEVWQMFDSAAW
jgi:predicted acetyltransferase